MKLRDIIPSGEQLELLRGVEENLLRRKRRSALSGIIALIVAILQILIAAFKDDYLTKLGEFFQNLLQWRFTQLLSPEGFAVAVLVVSAGSYFLFRWTSFLLKESEEPFRYTFWIEPFQIVGEMKPPAESAAVEQADSAGKRFAFKNLDRVTHLLHHDLMEMMNRRIRRLSLFDDSALESASSEALKSHIRISGHCAIREDKDRNWVIQVMPRIRIGSASGPETLTYPVEYLIYERDGVNDRTSRANVKTRRQQKTAKISKKPASQQVFLDAEKYTQIVEQVYSRIATEVYRQIESDVKGKIELFPTPFLRALALFHEADDFAKSNTVDAYDRAIELYKEALRYFRIAEVKWLTKFLLRPILWRLRLRFLHTQARVEIGYAKCLIYRRQISALSGRYRNPLFEIPENLNKVIDNLEQLHNLIIGNKKLKLVLRKDTSPRSNKQRDHNRSNSLKAYFTFPKDSWARVITFQPSQHRFAKQTQLRFEANVVAALTYYYLGAIQTAKDYLADARSAAPKLSECDPLYLLTAAEIEPDLDEEVLFFRQATELAPEFEIAQFLLAQNAEMRFRRQNEIVKERAEWVIKEYAEVLKINPGNIAALAAQGYLYWLIEDSKAAKQKLEQGRETKAIVRQTYIGNLNYGLARIEAEEGNFDKCYDLYTQAISVDPGVGAYSATIDAIAVTTAGDTTIGTYPVTANRVANTPYYDYIGPAMLKRFEGFTEKVEKNIKVKKARNTNNSKTEAVLQRTMDVIHSFVLNDYGNACLNYYLRFGDKAELEHAITAYQKAIGKDSQNKTAYFNLQNSYRYRGKEGDTEKGKDCLKKAERLGPTWPVVLIAAIQSEVRQILEALNEKGREKEQQSKSLADLKGKYPLMTRPTMPQGESLSVLRESQEAQKKFQEHEIKVERLNKEIEELQERLKNDVYKKLSKITTQTRLSLLEPDYNGQKVSELPEPRSAREKLEETDISALGVWAEALLYNEEAQESAKNLCRYLQNFYPEHFDYYYMRGNIYYDKQDYTRAIEFYHKAVESNSNNHGYFNSLGNAYFGHKDYAKAIEHYHRAIELNEETPIYECNLGRAHGNLAQWSQMIKHCQKAVELRKEHPEDNYSLDYYYQFLAEAYVQAQRLEEFEKTFDADTDLKNNERAWVFNRIGNLFFESKEYQTSVSYYKKAITSDQYVPIYQCNLGRSYGNLGQWEDMIGHCEKAVELRKSRSDDYYNLDYYYEFLAQAYFRSQRLEEFKNKFESDIELTDKERARVYNRIGNLLFESARYGDAIPQYEKAIALDAGYPLYYSNLGRAFTHQNQCPEAVDYSLKALELRKKVATDPYPIEDYYYYLAEAYKICGDPKKADEYFAKSNSKTQPAVLN
jgi:tetratricopeptide (TPR) repeat protein